MSTPVNQPITEITVEALAVRLAQGGDLQLIDVREPSEIATASIDGFTPLPLSQFAEWSGQIQAQFDPNIETIVLCHHGVRSAQMCQWLHQQGFTHLKNVTGGIDAYAIAVDPTVPRY
ncbi:MAG: rhodanese-related sulfurtransferase [Cyanobacteria bacterium RM1_2_2]|nr:rhodanese-related sulfurtransferase [Cyanobacteria bacterium RM1_2_2]